MMLGYLLGAFHGLVMIPLSFYLVIYLNASIGLKKKFPKTNGLILLCLFFVFLMVGYLISDSILDIISKTEENRLILGKQWAVGIYFGLMALGIGGALLSRAKALFKPRKTPRRSSSIKNDKDER